jgi:PEP-CTERM motif
MRSLRAFCVAALLLYGITGFAANVTGTLYFTTFSGGNNVHSVGFTYNPDVSLTLGSIVNLTPTPGADGLLFDPINKNLVVAGQSSGFVSEESPMGGPVTNVNVGSAGQSYHLALTSNNSALWNMANGQNGFISVVPLPFGTPGTSFPVTGSDTDIRGVIFDPQTSQYYYTTAPDGGQGNFGSIVFTGSGFVTTRIASGLFAHGISYDPFSHDLIVNSANVIQQITPTGMIVGQITTAGDEFDQAAENGKGLLFVASNTGNLEFADYAATGNIGTATFTSEQFLAGSLDDIAPLSGQGSQTPEPGTLLLLGTSVAGIAGILRRKLTL